MSTIFQINHKNNDIIQDTTLRCGGSCGCGIDVKAKPEADTYTCALYEAQLQVEAFG